MNDIIYLLLITMIILYGLLFIFMFFFILKIKKNIKKFFNIFHEEKIFALLLSISSIICYTFSKIINKKNNIKG
jgi:hypothetical protein